MPKIFEKIVLSDRRGELEFLDIKPLFIGYEHCEKGHSFGPSFRTCYLVHFIGDGKGVFIKDKKTHKIAKGQAFLIKPNEIIEYRADNMSPWKYSWIGFTGNFAKSLDGLEQCVFNLSPLYYDEIKSLAKNGREVIPEQVVSIVFKLLSQILSKNNDIDYVDGVKSYIEQNFMNDISIEQIAFALSLDRRYLSRIFKAKTGVGLKQYLIDYKIGKSIEFMKKGYNISQSASMCGYFDQFNFSKIFKKNMGVSPKEYLNQIKEKTSM